MSNSRPLGTAVETHIDSSHVHAVLMAKLEFTTSGTQYVHTGLGTIPFEGDTYLGVGDLARFGGVEESERIVPAPVRIGLSGLNSTLFAEALDASNFGDRITLWIAHRDDAGDLLDEPTLFYRGNVETSGVQKGVDDNSVEITAQHALAILQEKIGSRFTDEDQQRKYPGDLGFEFVEQMRTLELTWGAISPGQLRFQDTEPRPGEQSR